MLKDKVQQTVHCVLCTTCCLIGKLKEIELWGDNWQNSTQQQLLQALHYYACKSNRAIMIQFSRSWFSRYGNYDRSLTDGIVAVRQDSQKSEQSTGESSWTQAFSTLVGMPSGPGALPSLHQAELAPYLFLCFQQRKGSQQSCTLIFQILYITLCKECIQFSCKRLWICYYTDIGFGL